MDSLTTRSQKAAARAEVINLAHLLHDLELDDFRYTDLMVALKAMRLITGQDA